MRSRYLPLLALIAAGCDQTPPPKPFPPGATAPVAAAARATPAPVATPKPVRGNQFLVEKNALVADMPLTVKELIFQLRGGASNTEVLAEVMRRGVVQAPTPEEIGNLQSAGASPQLMDAVKSPDYVLNPQERAAYERRKPVRR
jgi:hypothetical protein